MGLDLLGRIKRHTEEAERYEGEIAREVSLVSSRATSASSVKKGLAINCMGRTKEGEIESNLK